MTIMRQQKEPKSFRKPPGLQTHHIGNVETVKDFASDEDFHIVGGGVPGETEVFRFCRTISWQAATGVRLAPKPPMAI